MITKNQEPLTEYWEQSLNIDKADYSFAQVYQVYAENERSAQVDIFLNPNILKKIHLAKNAVIFQLVTFFNENKKMSKDQFRDKDREPNNIIIEGEPGHISTTNKFTLDIGKKEFGQWLFRVRLAFLDFPSAENPTASKISRNRNRTRRSCHHRYPSPAASHRAPILLTLAPSELHPNFRFWLYPEVTEASPEVRFQAPSGHRCGHSII